MSKHEALIDSFAGLPAQISLTSGKMVLVRSAFGRTFRTIGKPIVLHIVLWEPEIPPNTGNIARLCAATESRLHLVGKRGFRLDDRQLKRAGLDYWPHVDLHEYADWEEFVVKAQPNRVWLATTKARANYTAVAFQDDDFVLFGSESRGVPDSFHTRYADTSITIPMVGSAVRSLNLATAVGIVLYEALRQVHRW